MGATVPPQAFRTEGFFTPMELDVVFLSRLQFALTVMFHYIFPPLSIGLGLLMVMMEGMYLRTRDPQYEAMAKFWTKVFAVNFAMGVASGIVMEFQFGMNWSTYSRFVGDVFGSALAAEGIFAFFLESGFLAVLVFGWDRVSPRMHFFSTCMVSLGSIFSAVWIVVANSWQQTPAGYHIMDDGKGPRAEITDFWAMVFNPSSVDRLLHVLIGCFILGAFFVMSICAWYLLKKRHEDFARKCFGLALVFGFVFSWLALIQGHQQAKTVSKTQPAKLAAYEGHYDTVDGPAPLVLFGIPDQQNFELKYRIAVPYMLSFLVHGDFTTPVRALDTYAPEDRPPLLIPFLSYRIMIGLGFFFIALTTFAMVLWLRGTLFNHRWLLWVFVFAVVGPYIANQLGWIAAEVGRQPWVVYELLRTADGVSKVVPASHVLASIILFSIIYTLLFVVWLWVMNSKIQHGPDSPEEVLAARARHQGWVEAAAYARSAGSLTESRMRQLKRAAEATETKEKPKPNGTMAGIKRRNARRRG